MSEELKIVLDSINLKTANRIYKLLDSPAINLENNELIQITELTKTLEMLQTILVTKGLYGN